MAVGSFLSATLFYDIYLFHRTLWYHQEFICKFYEKNTIKNNHIYLQNDSKRFVLLLHNYVAYVSMDLPACRKSSLLEVETDAFKQEKNRRQIWAVSRLPQIGNTLHTSLSILHWGAACGWISSEFEHSKPYKTYCVRVRDTWKIIVVIQVMQVGHHKTWYKIYIVYIRI